MTNLVHQVKIGNTVSIKVSDNKALQCTNSKGTSIFNTDWGLVRSLHRKHNNSQLCRQLNVQCGPVVLLLGQWQPERRLWSFPGILQWQHMSPWVSLDVLKWTNTGLWGRGFVSCLFRAVMIVCFFTQLLTIQRNKVSWQENYANSSEIPNISKCTVNYTVSLQFQAHRLR